MTLAPALAVAHANIALVKYWGKRDAGLNLPAAGSLSLTLDRNATTTWVSFEAGLDRDLFVLQGAPGSASETDRVSRFLDLVRAQAGIDLRARIASANDFATASGLASSASAFAALALASTTAAGLHLVPTALSVLARRGSGSAARSVFGGFVEMAAGERDDGCDSCAHPVLAPEAWDVALVVAVLHGGARKETLSTDGMDRTARTSPLYPGWLASVPVDLKDARDAILTRDLERLGEVTERSFLTMHASAMAARPAVLYFRGATLDTIHAVRGARAQGLGAWATADAGPHVKVLCAGRDAAAVETLLKQQTSVTDVRICRPGPGARLMPIDLARATLGSAVSGPQ